MTKFALILISFLHLPITYAQPSFTCGTQLELAHQPIIMPSRGPASTVPDVCLKKEITIYAYIVKDSTGKLGTSLADIYTAIDSVNKYFSPICLKFKVCKIIYIDNWNYDDFGQKKHEEQVRTLYCTTNIINMIFVKNIIDPAGANGYAPIAAALPPPNPKDIVVIKKSPVATLKKVICHELGHLFGLYHTFETKFGAELVDATNCKTSGDLICDTEADINPSSVTNCQYTGKFIDTKGNLYLPPIGNIMSFHDCFCKFTTEQYNKMAFVFFNYRKYLL